jgi:hypothetical protein
MSRIRLIAGISIPGDAFLVSARWFAVIPLFRRCFPAVSRDLFSGKT